MGMFDEVICEWKLPIPELQNDIFQTKDFDSLMNTYKITTKGELLKEEIEYELVPEEKRPYYGTKKWEKGVMFKLFGAIKKNRLGWVNTNFDGTFVFYTYKNKQFYQFEAKFVNGNLMELRTIKNYL